MINKYILDELNMYILYIFIYYIDIDKDIYMARKQH